MSFCHHNPPPFNGANFAPPEARAMIGAQLTDGGVALRVWAPDQSKVSVVIEGTDIPMQPEPGGYFTALLGNAKAGTRYRLRPGDDAETYPDPASRFQPDGPHGDSVVVDERAYAWHDEAWRGPDPERLVIYEMHVGTFTHEGTWRAAIEHLRELRETGITMIEMMPVNEFAGEFGWGYDGVDLWAPSHLYGSPDDLRAFVDAAHQEDLAVTLDVVYNHLGPDGCYLRKFTDRYFTDRYKNEWGDALNFDGEGCEGVREFIAGNAAYWIRDFHFDGLRIDATQSLLDGSKEHIIKTIVNRVRDAASGRRTFVVGENEPQHAHLITEYGLDALWNDDFHHAARVAATGKREAYYFDYRGAAQEFVSMAKMGFLFQGQRYAWQKKRRGTPSIGLPHHKLVDYLQNHDQIANSARGERLHQITSPGRYRALTALLLLGPHTPMLFQGQEFGASAPFQYFADHTGDLAEAVAKGRQEFLQQFQSIAASDTPLARPDDRATFEACKLDHAERESHREHVALHRELLALRPSFAGPVEGAVLGEECFVLRFRNRLLIINLGHELRLDVIPEPLLAPPLGATWEIEWASEEIAPLEREDCWIIPAEAAVVMRPNVGAAFRPPVDSSSRRAG
jgi:maltooligosyltrehalose trehalohydrolase